MTKKKPELRMRYKTWGGWTEFYSHASAKCQSEMRFSVYQPPQAEKRKVPVLYWLSGLSCTEENFMLKAGAQKFAAKYGVLIVAPDTSPRNVGIEGENDDWDFGTGAGFYLNATRPRWSTYYRMYDYLVDELPLLVEEHFSVDLERQGIFGHSMGGHGAMVIGLRNPNQFKSISALSPISAPSQCSWGQKAFRGYLGEDRSLWDKYDTTELISEGLVKVKTTLFVDQGTEDEYLNTQLLPEKLERACREHKVPLNLRMHKGYDHSYYFVSSFIGDHIAYHSEVLGAIQ